VCSEIDAIMAVVNLSLFDCIGDLHQIIIDLHEAAPSPLPKHRTVSLVIWLLSKSLSLTEAYLRFTSPSVVLRTTDGTSDNLVILQLLAWLRQDEERVVQALSDIENIHRVRADMFLIRSLVAQFIDEQNRRGFTVPTDTAIEMYLRYWSHRSCAVQVQRGLIRLTHHRNERRKFGQLLRSEWMFQFSSIKIARDLEFDEIRLRVFT
jgi:hypothetical protein